MPDSPHPAAVLKELDAKYAAAAAGDWNWYGSDEPSQGKWEAAPGLSIGSVEHTEPIARFSGYLMDCRANAELCFALHNNYPGLRASLDEMAGALREVARTGCRQVARDALTRAGYDK